LGRGRGAKRDMIIALGCEVAAQEMTEILPLDCTEIAECFLTNAIKLCCHTIPDFMAKMHRVHVQGRMNE